MNVFKINFCNSFLTKGDIFWVSVVARDSLLCSGEALAALHCLEVVVVKIWHDIILDRGRLMVITLSH